MDIREDLEVIYDHSQVVSIRFAHTPVHPEGSRFFLNHRSGASESPVLAPEPIIF